MKTDTPETDVWEAYCDECYYHMWRLRRKTARGWYDGFHIHTGEEAKGLCEILNKLERERDEAREIIDEAREVLKITQEAWVKAKAERVEALRERDEAREYADRLAEGLPDGMLPKDVEVLREANLGLATELATVTAQRDGMEEKLRIELRGHPDSELWGDAGLIAATMRCVDALDVVTAQRDGIDSMYHKIIKEVLECDPIPACKREDDHLEPPWEVIARIREQRDRLAGALRSIKNELGVPQPEYPAPVANAVKIADEVLQSLTRNDNR